LRKFKLGIIVCILSGILSPMLNLAVAFGEYVQMMVPSPFRLLFE
jgi:hypothetical protein